MAIFKRLVALWPPATKSEFLCSGDRASFSPLFYDLQMSWRLLLMRTTRFAVMVSPDLKPGDSYRHTGRAKLIYGVSNI